MIPATRDQLRWDRFAWAFIAAGAALRIGWTLGVHPPIDHVFSDMQAYVNRATRLADGQDLTHYDSFFPPGTHVLLAVPLKILGSGRRGLWAASVLWAVLSALIPYLGWRVARWYLSRRGAALATAAIALWPLSITYGGYFLSETPTAVCLLLLLWLTNECVHATARRRAVWTAGALGLSAGAALAVRPQLALSVLIAGGAVLARSIHRGSVVRAAVVGIAIPVVAALALNARAAGEFAGLSENGGFNFFQGHCVARDVVTGTPGNSLSFGSPVAVQLNRGHDFSFPDHLAWEQSYFFDVGKDCIRADGISHVKILGYNVLDLGFTTVPWPQSTDGGLRGLVDATNTGYTLVLVPAMLVAIDGLISGWRRTRRLDKTVVLLAHLVSVIPTALIFYGDPRFRTPYDVVGIILIAVVVERMMTRSGTEASVGGLAG